MIETAKKYCNSLTKYSRYKTREVNIGGLSLGGSNPIRIQSMTITDTMDTKATVEQTIRMVEAGCEYVRITAPSMNEAKNLDNIKKELRSRGYDVPLIADIHFTPNAAELAARIVEKVRVNPGNYADKKRFENIEYTDDTYEAELDRIRKKFTPLVKICKEHGTAMRIGTNHGSLSDRIMSRYGDTPLGMVESALEFVRICEENDYREIVLSMKASNPQVMVQAYRLLVAKMEEEGMNYPLHLGVTEAGGGEDGRIKSAVGIGTLLEDGLGDTVRVSLTEDPEFEAPVAISLVNRYKDREDHKPIEEIDECPVDPFTFTKRKSSEVEGIGDSNVPVVVADYSDREITTEKDLNDIGYFYDAITDKWSLSDSAADIVYVGNANPSIQLPTSLKVIKDFKNWQKDKIENCFPLLNVEDLKQLSNLNSEMIFIQGDINSFNDDVLEEISSDKNIIIVLTTDNKHGMAEQRRFFYKILQKEIANPVIIKRDYKGLTTDEMMLYSSMDFGGLLIDGFGDGVWMTLGRLKKREDIEKSYVRSFIRKEESLQKIINRVLFGILQAARARISKTEYIACPSCGRTLFDLQETTDMIRKRTEHLKGLKIAVMGCIVNGPGEMADADYGYVGSGVGKITLYKEKDVVKKNIPFSNAVDELIELIKEDGNWIEPM